MRADVPGSREPSRYVDGGAEGQGGNWPHARSCLQELTNCVGLRHLLNALVELFDLGEEQGPDFEQWSDELLQERIPAGNLPDATVERAEATASELAPEDE